MFSSIMEAGKKPSVLTSISDGLYMLLFNVWRKKEKELDRLHDSYVEDLGFAGERPRRRWQAQRQVDLVTPPHQRSKRMHWPGTLVHNVQHVTG